MPSYLAPDGKGGTLLTLRVTPGASQSSIDGIHGDLLKVRVKSPPADGKANKELLKFLARTLDIRPGNIEIIRGHKSRQKTVQITDVSPDLIAEKTKAP